MKQLKNILQRYLLSIFDNKTRVENDVKFSTIGRKRKLEETNEIITAI